MCRSTLRISTGMEELRDISVQQVADRSADPQCLKNLQLPRRVARLQAVDSNHFQCLAEVGVIRQQLHCEAEFTFATFEIARVAISQGQALVQMCA